jgi:hypothetical protein
MRHSRSSASAFLERPPEAAYASPHKRGEVNRTLVQRIQPKIIVL